MPGINDPFNSALNSAVASSPTPIAPAGSFIGSNYGQGYSSTGGVSPRDHFLQQITKAWNTSVPMSTQWVVLIDSFPKSLNSSIIRSLERTDGDKHGFDINKAVEILTNNSNQSIVGCLFAHDVTIPSEEYTIDTAIVQNNRGFIPGIISGNRKVEAPSLNLTFKETNTSFIDFVIRPWVILSSHYGMVARDPNDPAEAIKNMKVTLRVLEYTRTRANVAMIPRKTFVFHNCVPYNVSEQTLDYEQEKVQTFRTLWTYSNYTVSPNLYLPIDQILKG